MDDWLWLGPYLPLLVLGVGGLLLLVGIWRQGRAYKVYRREQDAVDAAWLRAQGVIGVEEG